MRAVSNFLYTFAVVVIASLGGLDLARAEVCNWDRMDCSRFNPASDQEKKKEEGSASAIVAIERAVQAVPRPKIVERRSGDYGYFNLKIEKLCGGSGISDVITSWVDEASYSSVWGGKIRTAALVVVAKVGAKEVKIPLIAVSNVSGQRGIKPCTDLDLLADIPSVQKVDIRFEFATTEQRKLGDAKPVLEALANLATAAGQLHSFSGSLVIGSSAGATASFLKDNTGPLAAITAAVNSLLSLMDKKSAPRPTEITIGNSTTRVGYVAGAKEVFAVYKDWRSAKPHFVPKAGYGSNVTYAYGQAFPQKNLYTTFGTVTSSQQGWTSSPDKFCNALRDTVMAETEGDRVTMYVAASEHANYAEVLYRDFPDAFKKNRRTCLYAAEAKILVDLGWPQPFKDAFVQGATNVASNVPVAPAAAVSPLNRWRLFAAQLKSTR